MFNTGLFAPIYQYFFSGRARGGSPIRQVKVHSLKMQLDVRETIQSIMAHNSYEPEQTAWCRECLAPGDRFVDVGANFGWYTALATSLVGETGSVFAFEPSPVASAVIADTILRNNLKNVTLVRSAVGDTIGKTQIYMPVNDTVHSPSVFYSDPHFVPIDVSLTSLDGFAPLADGRPIKFIKIDVEGYEPNVIRGMQGLIQKGLVENIFCEFNSGWLKRNDITSAQLFDLITSYGFVVHKKTALSTGADRSGGTFESQDFWFKRAH